MITTTYDYSAGAGFTYDSSKIGFAGGAATLLIQPNPGQTFSPVIADSTYNASFLEFAGGVLRQKDTRPVGFLVYYAWATALGGSGLDGNYGTAGIGVSVFGGAPTISGGFLDLTGGTNKSVSLADAATYGPQNIATVAFRVKPNYTGNPSTPQYFIASGLAVASLLNFFSLRHAANGHIFIEFYSSAGVGVGTLTNYDFGLVSFVSGTTYEIVLQIDITNGATKLFVNGVQSGTTNVSTGTRTNNQTIMRVGHDTFSNAAAGTNLSIKDLSIYNSIIAPVDAFSLNPYVYNAATAVLPAFAYPGPAGNVIAWSSLAISDTNVPHYTLNNLYWNGSAWVASDGSYAQSNTAAVVTANISMLSLSNALTVRAIYDNSNTLQMSLASALLTYSGQIYPTTNPSISPNTPLTLDSLNSFTADTDATGSDGVKFYLKIGSQNYWWDSAAWSISDGTYTQSNTATEINDNAAALQTIVELGVLVTPYALLHSASGATAPSITSLTLVYSYFGPQPSGPNICTVFGYIIDEGKNIVPNAKVTVNNPTTFFNQGVIQAQGPLTVVSNELGYFEIDLAETATVNKRLTWTVAYAAGRGNFSFGRAVIPDQATINIEDLAFIP